MAKRLLDSVTGLTSATHTFQPPNGETWVVEEVIVSGACDLKKKVDPGEDGTYEIGPITKHSFSGSDDLHAILEILDGGDGASAGQSALEFEETAGTGVDIALHGTKQTH